MILEQPGLNSDLPNGSGREWGATSPMGGNVGDDKGWNKKVISTAMDASSGSGDNGYGKDV